VGWKVVITLHRTRETLEREKESERERGREGERERERGRGGGGGGWKKEIKQKTNENAHPL